MNSESKILKSKSWWGNIDKIIFIPTLILFLFGVISITSISQHLDGRFAFSYPTFVSIHEDLLR